ncbi:MAG: outer membrane protein assembly factor BamE [Pararhodobacter sp.]
MSFKNIAAAFVAVSFLAGCGPESQGNQAISDSSRVDQIVVGTTTREDVRATLGEPETRWREFGDEHWSYRFQRESMNAAMFIPVAQMVAGRVNVDFVNVTVSFDRAGVVNNLVRVCHRSSGGIMTGDRFEQVAC